MEIFLKNRHMKKIWLKIQKFWYSRLANPVIAKGEIWPWWEKWGIGEIPEHSDVADMIEWKLKNRKI